MRRWQCACQATQTLSSPAYTFPTGLMSSCKHRRASSALSGSKRTSASSPLTWKMGAFSALATSVQYALDRLLRGSVVNATYDMRKPCILNIQAVSILANGIAEPHWHAQGQAEHERAVRPHAVGIHVMPATRKRCRMAR